MSHGKSGGVLLRILPVSPLVYRLSFVVLSDRNYAEMLSYMSLHLMVRA